MSVQPSDRGRTIRARRSQRSIERDVTVELPTNDISVMMRTEWDEIARRNPFYGIASARDFQDPTRIDMDRFWASGREQVDSLLRSIDLNPVRDGTVVEIGCGLGRMTHRLAELFKHVYAVDVSPEMIERARSFWRTLGNVEFVLGNGTDLRPIPTARARFVFSYIALQHIPDASMVLGYIRESARVLETDGTALLQLRISSPVSLGRRLRATVPPGLRQLIKNHVRLWHPPRPRHDDSPDLEAEFSRDYRCWSGGSVDPHAVNRVAKDAGLRIENLRGVGTQYTFYTFRRTA